MQTYRFIAKTINQESPYIAFSTLASDRGHAQSNVRYRFNEDDQIISVNVKEDNQWRVIEGAAVTGVTIEAHPDQEMEFEWEGCTATTDTVTPVRQPMKRPGFYSADLRLALHSNDLLTDSLLAREEVLPAGKDPWIVHTLFFAFVALVMISFGMFFGLGDHLSAADAAATVLDQMGLPLFGTLIGGFALHYLAGTHHTQRRRELRQQAFTAANPLALKVSDTPYQPSTLVSARTTATNDVAEVVS